MDARRAIFRAKKEAARKRIDSPLVRYNDLNQPVCKICNISLKSDSAWPAHQISRKHKDAVENYKANASKGAVVSDNKSSPAAQARVPVPTFAVPKSRPASSLPVDFFDNSENKRLKTDTELNGEVQPVPMELDGSSSSLQKGIRVNSSDSSRPSGSVSKLGRVTMIANREEAPSPLNVSPAALDDLEVKQANGGLPEGFFDNKDADLRARGIEPVKLDIKDEYKEFQKEIQDDLQEFDDRVEEEEYDAAEWRDVEYSVEQKAFMEKVDMLKKNLIEKKASKIQTAPKKKPAFMREESSDDSSGEDDDENFDVDWRAKQL